MKSSNLEVKRSFQIRMLPGQLVLLLSFVAAPEVHAECQVLPALSSVFSSPLKNASDQVQAEVMRTTHHLRAQQGKLSPVKFEELSSQEYAQGFLQWMRDLGARVETPKDEIDRVLKNTQFSELQRLENLARERQFFRYERLKAEGARLKLKGGPEELLRAERISKSLTRDGVALGNGPHVEEVIHHIDSHRAALLQILKSIHPYSEAQLDHYLQYLKTLASVHDLGKTFPDVWVKRAAEKVEAEGGNVFVTERIAFHEFSSAVSLKGIGLQYQFNPSLINSLIRNILGHNDGSGLKNIFWNSIAFPETLLGHYPVPDTLSSKILALADRGGQGTLGASGGVFKITKQEMGRKPFSQALLSETMSLSPSNTILQIKAIAKNVGLGMEQNAMTLDLIKAQQNALDAFAQIEWNPDKTSGKIAGHAFANADEFFEFVNRKDAEIKAGQESARFWLGSHSAHRR